jgi:hypothetical protein
MTLSTSPRRATSTAFGSSSRPERHATETTFVALLASPCRTSSTVCGSPPRHKHFGIGVTDLRLRLVVLTALPSARLHALSAMLLKVRS